jgi:hypothetical protein
MKQPKPSLSPTYSFTHIEEIMHKLSFLLIMFAATASAQTSPETAPITKPTASKKEAAKALIQVVNDYANQAERLSNVSPQQARRTRNAYFLDYAALNDKIIHLNESAKAEFVGNDPQQPLAACGMMANSFLTYWNVLIKGQNGNNTKRYISRGYKNDLATCQLAIDQAPE